VAQVDAEARMSFEQITWVIKLSKLCNMRCSYCYEWDQLANRERMSAALVERLLVAAREVHLQRAARAPVGPVVSTLVLHGGEPLVLPVEYLRDFFTCARRVFGAHALDSGAIRFGVQTNLLVYRDDVIDLLLANRVAIGVSFDFVPGVRLSLARQPTESTVARNIDRLRSRGATVGGLAVLARHTAPRITDVYDFFAARGMGLRVLPLFDGPDGRPAEDFAIGEESMVSALMKLFEHWIDTGSAVRVMPLAHWLENVLRYVVGVRAALYDRRERGDGIFIVDTDGRLYGVRDAYDPARALGDLREQAMVDILASARHAASVARDAQVLETVCGKCDFAGACDGSPATHTMGGRSGDRCPVAAACHERIARYLRDAQCDRESLCALLAETQQRDAAGRHAEQAMAAM
jgi:uncharacterized protein